MSGNAYAQEHDSAPTSSHMQPKDDGGNPDQVAASFGDMNISVAVCHCSELVIRNLIHS